MIINELLIDQYIDNVTIIIEYKLILVHFKYFKLINNTSRNKVKNFYLLFSEKLKIVKNEEGINEIQQHDQIILLWQRVYAKNSNYISDCAKKNY